jgi:predicted DNA-binding protein (MmcQ/YjbR family)
VAPRAVRRVDAAAGWLVGVAGALFGTGRLRHGRRGPGALGCGSFACSSRGRGRRWGSRVERGERFAQTLHFAGELVKALLDLFTQLVDHVSAPPLTVRGRAAIVHARARDSGPAKSGAGRRAVPIAIAKPPTTVGDLRHIQRVSSATRHHLGVTSEELRECCLSFLRSKEEFPFGPETFKVAGRIFALSRLAQTPVRVSLKCDPTLAEQLHSAHPSVIPGYHLNKRHRNTVIIDGSLPDTMIGDMIEDSYDLVLSKLPRARHRALAWPGDG